MSVPSIRSATGLGGSVGVVFLLLAPFLASCSDSTAPLYSFWEGSLKPIRPSVVGGRVVAVTQNGKTDIGITIQDGQPGVAYGWRVDSGGCEESGLIQGGPAAYPPLLPGQGGSASAETSVAPLFKPGKRFSGRVFLSSGSGPEQVVACGELEETSS